MERVPPAVSLNFERLVMEVCNRAKLDFDDWPLEARELLNHLETRWREGIERGLSTEAAEERAILLFGGADQVAKSLRRPWLKRVLFYRRYRAERYFWILGVTAIKAWPMAHPHPDGSNTLWRTSISIDSGFIFQRPTVHCLGVAALETVEMRIRG